MKIIELLYVARKESDEMGKFDDYLNDISEIEREINKRQDRIAFLKGDPWIVNQRHNMGEIEQLKEEIGELKTLLRRYRES